uniref:SPK domain-containing protein n=1 Tax=Caenorhabditis tropicalis TaxID=1561998 RepID=A0A1I7T348_9PELO
MGVSCFEKPKSQGLIGIKSLAGEFKMLTNVTEEVDTIIEPECTENATLDNAVRITEYIANDGHLTLKGTHVTNTIHLKIRVLFVSANQKFISGKDAEILRHLVQTCATINSPTPLSTLAREFLETIGSSSNLHSIIHRLREDALVEVDDENRITKYEANDGTSTAPTSPILAGASQNQRLLINQHPPLLTSTPGPIRQSTRRTRQMSGAGSGRTGAVPREDMALRSNTYLRYR